MTAELQRRLTEAGIDHVRAVGSHPGWTMTNLVSNEPWYIRLVNKIMAQSLQMGTTPQLCSVGAGLLPADHKDSASDMDFFGPSGMKSMWGPAAPMPMFRVKESRDPVLGARIWDLTNKQVGIDSWACDGSSDGKEEEAEDGAGARAASSGSDSDEE